MDALSPERRSENMRRIRSRDTAPELLVRRSAHRLGYRFRLHRRDLPGKPDLLFPRLRKAVFVHGCFWHQHADCREGRVPGTNRSYWGPKLARTVERDRLAVEALRSSGWDVLTIWECETGDPSGLSARLAQFLDS
jgi:DNA mismatch endonuclease (patch repair protein)